ncbi:MAG: hypothetical protein ISS71_00960 [Phycisphaerae bacterium]|nr:hypothetical protein [Phycisphaerae bacterium]
MTTSVDASLTESFSKSGTGMILFEDKGPSNEDPVLIDGSGLTWGGYISLSPNHAHSFEVNADDNTLELGKRVVHDGAYIYTRFTANEDLSDTTASIRVTAGVADSVTAATDVCVMIRAAGEWYICDTGIDLLVDQSITTVNLNGLTWTAVTNPSVLDDNFTPSNEAPLTLGAAGIDLSVATGSGAIAMADGGGLYFNGSENSSATLIVYEISWLESDVVTNIPPNVNAGINQTSDLAVNNGQVQLIGTADDGGDGPGPFTTTWSQTSGPGTAVFSDYSILDPTVTFDQTGLYQLQLLANDGLDVRTDVVQIDVIDSSLGVYYVAVDGDNSNPGTLNLPWATIQKAADTLLEGQTCYIRGGRYSDTVNISNLHGTATEPVIFEKYNGEDVILEGTIPITSGWTVHSGNIYKTTISQDVWQLFVDDQMVTAARWPNSYNVTRPDYGGIGGPEPGSFFDMDGTRARQAANSTYGHMVSDSGYFDLAATGKDFSGAMLVGFRMIVSGNDVFYEQVTSHTTGSNEFDFTQQTYGSSATGSIPLDQGRYYLTSHLNCLDQPGEWYYDTNTGRLYLWTEDSDDPSLHQVRGKVNEYVLNVSNSSYIQFRGIRLFATAFDINGSDHIVFDGVRSSFPSYAKLMLKSVEEANTNILDDTSVVPSGNTMRNCEVEYAESRTVMIECAGNFIENSYFHHATWGRTNFGVLSDKKGGQTTYRRCTFSTWGKGNALKCGPATTIEYCRAFNAYYNGDNSGFQIPSGGQEGSVLHHNWIHDCRSRNGIRFDGDPAGIRATVYRTVSLRNGKGYRLKGDQHNIMNIIGLENSPSADINIAFDKFYGYDPAGCMEYECRIDGRRGSFPFHGNENSIVRNIAGDLITSDPIPAVVQGGIWEGLDEGSFLKDQLRDPYNFDFRPVSGSELIDAGTETIELPEVTNGYIGVAPDIGAYEYGESNYWIPGHRTDKARTPVPPDGSMAVKPNADLMWLEGLDAISHDVYFGTNPNNLVFHGNQVNNIFDPGPLTDGIMYYWRIDTVTSTGTVTGDVWTLMSNPSTVPVVFDPVDDSYANAGILSPQGAAPYLQVKDTNVGYLKFDVSGFNNPIGSAILRLATVSDPNKLPINPKFYSVSDNNWNEETLIGSNMPLLISEIQTLTGPFETSTYYEIDVSSVVTTPGVYSFAIKDTTATNKARWSSKEGDYRPELILTPSSGPDNYPPTFVGNTFDKPNAIKGVPYTESIENQASDPEGDSMVFSKISGPDWLNVDPDGTIWGTPGDDLGSNTWTVRVEDGISEGSDDSNMTIFVNNTPDIDGLGKVNLADFAILARNWLDQCASPNWCEGADLDISGTVNYDDLEVFVQSWLDG